MDKIAKRILNVQKMNETQAIRAARTIVTGAENKGRQDSYARAEADGIILQKEWLSSDQPGRTRDWHMPSAFTSLVVDQDKPFENSLGKIMFPGDPSAHGANVWNCRCSMAAVVKGFKKAQVQKAMVEKVETGEVVVNKNGNVIDFDPRLSGEEWRGSIETIKQLSKEYETKLTNVRQFEKGENKLRVAGDVSPFGEMRLSSKRKDVAVHEFLHSLATTHDAKWGLPANKEFWKEIRKVRTEYQKHTRLHPTDKISFYAEDNLDEFLAESFIHAKCKELGIDVPDHYGTDYTFSQKVLSIVDKYFKRKKK